MEFDHKTPHSKGAPASIDNIQLVCRKCNIAKRDKTPKCPHCGSWIPHDAGYCQKCGSRQSLNKPNAGTDFLAIVRKVVAVLLLLYVIGYLLSNR
jgi:ribosomal protein L40E